MLQRIYRRWYYYRERLKGRHYILGVLAHVGSIVALAFVMVLFFTLYILQPYEVYGDSMSPTLQNGDRLFILRSGKVLSDALGVDHIPKRGEIVIIHSKVNEKKWVKRVIGLPGERIVIKDNVITVYNRGSPGGFKVKLDLDPPLEDFPPAEPVVDRIIGKGEIFILGDNRLEGASDDSRSLRLGNVSIDDIDGVVVVRVVPVLDFRFFF